MEMKSSVIGIVVAALLIGAAGGYFSAATLGKSSESNQDHQGGSEQFRRRSEQSSFDNSRVFGEVQSINDGRITVQSQNNGSQIVLFNDSTSYQRTIDGSTDDVAAGTRVLVTGQQNPDGSTTAATIQILQAEADFPFEGRQGDHQGNQTNTEEERL